MDKKLRSIVVVALALAGVLTFSTQLPADTGTCGGVAISLPFTDVGASPFFCQIAEAFVSGLTNGTSATTYSPASTVSRDQMAAFITRTQDSILRRGSRRAILKQWSTPTSVPMTGRTTIGAHPIEVVSDGADLWVAGFSSGDVRRVRASDGSILGRWTGAIGANGVLVARGRVYVSTQTQPGHIYVIDPSQPPGVVTFLSQALGDAPKGITTDGQFIWTANFSSVSKVNPANGTSLTFTTGFVFPHDILFDGTNLWVTDADIGNAGMLRKLDSSGAVVQNVTVGVIPERPVFDGSNIWVPNRGGQSVSVVRARDGIVLATLTGNGLNGPLEAAFDGQRVLVTNSDGDSVSMWNAADLTPLGSFTTGAGTSPIAACSDGINFWITLVIPNGTGQLARF